MSISRHKTHAGGLSNTCNPFSETARVEILVDKMGKMAIDRGESIEVNLSPPLLRQSFAKLANQPWPESR